MHSISFKNNKQAFVGSKKVRFIIPVKTPDGAKMIIANLKTNPNIDCIKFHYNGAGTDAIRQKYFTIERDYYEQG